MRILKKKTDVVINNNGTLKDTATSNITNITTITIVVTIIVTTVNGGSRCVASRAPGTVSFFYIISNYRLLSNMPGSHTTTSTMSMNTMTTTTSSTSGSSSCEGSMSGRKGRGRRMGLEMRLVSSPWFFFFSFFFSHYTDSSLHLYLGLPLPVMPPIRNHEKRPKRCETRRLGLM